MGLLLCPSNLMAQTKSIDSLKNISVDSTHYAIWVQQKLDSLQKLNLPHKVFLQKFDSISKIPANKISVLQSKGDSIYSKLETKVSNLVSRGYGKVDTLYSKVTSKKDSLEYKLNQKAQKLNKLTDLKRVDNKLREIEKKIAFKSPASGEVVDAMSGLTDTKKKLPQLNTKISAKDNANLNQLKEGIGEIDQVKEWSDKLNEVKDIPNEQIAKFKNIEEVDKINNQIGEVKEIGAQVNVYKKEVEQLSKNGLNEMQDAPKSIEKKVGELGGVQELKNQKSLMNAQTEEFEKLKDEEYAKQKMIEEAKKVTIDYFAQHQDKLKAAQKKLSSLKKKYGNLASVSDTLKKKENPMKEKSFGQRLRVGMGFQLHKSKPFGLDISPNLTYQLTKKFSIGASGTYRTSIDGDEKYFITRENEAYGIRVFTDRVIYKGFFGHVEFERLHTKNSKVLIQDVASPQNWENGLFMGLGKTFNFTKGIKGNVIVLYNFLNDKTNPNQKAWNIRFGFDLGDLSKNKKSNKQERINSIKNKLLGTKNQKSEI